MDASRWYPGENMRMNWFALSALPLMMGCDINSGFELGPAIKIFRKISRFKVEHANTNKDCCPMSAAFMGAMVVPLYLNHYMPTCFGLQLVYKDLMGQPSFVVHEELLQFVESICRRPTHCMKPKDCPTFDFKARDFLKREDELYTARKINNDHWSGWFCREKVGKKRIIAPRNGSRPAWCSHCYCVRLKRAVVSCLHGAPTWSDRLPTYKADADVGAEIIPATSGSQTTKRCYPMEAIRDWINHAQDTHYIIGAIGSHLPWCMVTQFAGRHWTGNQNNWRRQQVVVNSRYIASPTCVIGGSNAVGYHFQFWTKKLLCISF